MTLLMNQDHIAWPIFLAVFYSGVIWLAADAAWRCITMPVRVLAAAVLAVWLGGLGIILALT